MKVVISILFAIFFGTKVYAGPIGVTAKCQDQSTIELQLGSDSCLTVTGMNFMLERIYKHCSARCSLSSGKCSVSSWRNVSGECQEPEEFWFSGYTATCADGSIVEFNSCALKRDLEQNAMAQCSNRQGSSDGSLTSFVPKQRCN